LRENNVGGASKQGAPVRGVIVIIAFVLAACATSDAPTVQWIKPGSHSGDLALELFVCGKWSRTADNPNQVHEPYLRDCMTSHGWRLVASAPPVD
jgi:hypothetical protein